MLPLLLLAFVAPTGQTPPPQPEVRAEVARLSACHPTFKLAPPPLHIRVVWTQPFDITDASEGSGHVSIEFSIQYAQSDSFKTEAEAAKAQDFTPNFNLRQRNHYVLEAGRLRLLWRESLTDSHWQRQTVNQPEFACWQSQPDAQQPTAQ